MAEWSRRGLAAGVVGAGCTLRLDPALYGVTGIAKSRSGRQLRPRSSCRLSPLSTLSAARNNSARRYSRLQRWGLKLGGHFLLFTGYTAVFPEVTDFRPAEKPVTNFRNSGRVARGRLAAARTARGAQPTGPTPRHTTPTWSTSMARRRASKACRFRRESTGTIYTRVLFGCSTRLQKCRTVRPARTDSLPRALIAAQRGTSPLGRLMSPAQTPPHP